MFSFESDNFMNSVSQALNRPIQSRCAELTVLFDRGNAKDLQNLFPILIDNIFGPQGTLSWGLRNITAALRPQDFQTLQHFLSPCGPFFKLIYSLLKDPFIKYDLSVAYLPIKIRQLLESTTVHPFYSELVHVSPQNKQVVSLMLNPFDYYMFHFAYHLINSWHQRGGTTGASSWNTVYYILCCDYVLHFLPTDPNNTVTPIINYTGKNPMQYMQTFTRPARVSKLMLSSVYAEPINEFNSIHPPLERHPRSEIWRSETVLTVFLDMWLSNDQVSFYNERFNLSSIKVLQFNELPSAEYVRIIRVLVKQLHAFASSSKIDDSHMGELKKITIPMMQGKMYIFLRNLIHRWPLDGSFRLVLELWLSFIQPWRYPGNVHLKQLTNQPEINPDVEDMNFTTFKTVDREYLPFIAENILAYTVIFQQLLPRFTRVDLSSPKNSLMLYRLTKVFDQPNLVSLIQEVESCIEERNLFPGHTFNMSASTTTPLSPTSRWSTNTINYDLPRKFDTVNTTKDVIASNFLETSKHNCGKFAMIIKQKIYELEGPNFYYKPLFKCAAPEVYELLKQIKKSEIVAQDIIHSRMEEMKEMYSGFFGFFKSIFIKLDTSTDEFTLEERRKVPLYLDFSYQHLQDMFQVNECICTETENISEVSTLTHQQEFSFENFEQLLTSENVKQRGKNITYEGDPDLHPIRSTENKFFIRMLYHWATKINEQYSPLISKLYYDDTYVGKLARQFICPPIIIYKYDKSQPGRSPRIPQHLPPRISLRYFGSNKFLVYIIVGLLISRFYNYSALTFLLCVFILGIFHFCIKAFVL